MAKMLSKSDFMKFLQCGKYLWLHKYRPELEAKPDERQQSIFSQGFEVEKYAEERFKDAVRIENDDIFDADRETRTLMDAKTHILFQPTVIADSSMGAGKLMSRADILKYDPKAKRWDIYEIKSSTEAKPEHLRDVAFQKIAFESAGYVIGRTHLLYVNNKYVRRGPIDPRKLIADEDITAKVKAVTPEVKLNIPLALKVLKEKDEPQVRIIKQCSDPYDCPFIDYCWTQAKIPDYSVYDLTGISKKKLTQLLDTGVMTVCETPEGFPLSKAQEWQVLADKTGRRYVDKKPLAKILKRLRYPLYFLDYETWNPAIPQWDGFKPYQKIPFQYSLHIVRTPTDLELEEHELEHREFLPATKENPIPALLKQLKEDIADDGGSILVWNESFEKGRNTDMAKMFPKYRSFINTVNARVFDLMIPFRQKLIVDPGFKGSYSIKYVLPVLGGGVSYEDIEVDDGSDVGREWNQTVSGILAPSEVKRLRRKLLAYCGRDTYGIVRVLRTTLTITK